MKREIPKYKLDKTSTESVSDNIQTNKGNKEDLNNWRDIPCSWTKYEFFIVYILYILSIYTTIYTVYTKMSILPNANSKSQQVILQIWKKSILSYMWKDQTLRICCVILKKKSVGRLTLPDCKTYCHATVIKTAW